MDICQQYFLVRLEKETCLRVVMHGVGNKILGRRAHVNDMQARGRELNLCFDAWLSKLLLIPVVFEAHYDMLPTRTFHHRGE
jgi:hypothetical protein